MNKQAKQRVDPLKIYFNAERYRIADHVLRVEGHKDQNLMAIIGSPHMVLSAFASELYLKCLICLETCNAPPTHNLRALFRDLSLHTRMRIEQLWNNHMPQLEELWTFIEKETKKSIPRDLVGLLDISSKAFTQLRYAHEDDSGSFMVGDLPVMLRTVILEKRPLWATLRHTPPTSHPRGMLTQPATPPQSPPDDNQ